MQFSGIELFLDDEVISYTRNIRRESWQPRKYEGNPVVEDFGYLGTGGFGRDPNDLTNAFGRLPSDQTHAIRISSSAQLPLDFSLGVRYGYTTGRPYSRQITVRGLSQGVRTVLAEPSGSHFLPSVRSSG